MDYAMTVQGPAGEAVELSQTAYLMMHGDDMIVLGCTAAEPPDDHWRSIAETLELQPSGG